MPPPKRRGDLSYDDDHLTGGGEEARPAWKAKTPWPLTADELDCRWVPYQKGWLSIRDPLTGERVEVPTRYADVKLLPGQTTAPQEWVRRAMQKLPPKRNR